MMNNEEQSSQVLFHLLYNNKEDTSQHYNYYTVCPGNCHVDTRMNARSCMHACLSVLYGLWLRVTRGTVYHALLSVPCKQRVETFPH